jgi:hypothetical protein
MGSSKYDLILTKRNNSHRQVKATLITAFILVLFCLTIGSCRRSPTSKLESFSSDPIITLGHGVFIGADGKAFTPNAEFIEKAQNYYIATLLKHAEANQDKTKLPVEQIQKTQNRINELVEDRILAKALLVDWIIEKTQPVNNAQIRMKNNALRWYYVLDIQHQQVPSTKEHQWTRGIKPDIAKQLESEGVPVVQFLVTGAGGEAYVRQCRDAGVPVPNAMFSSEWGRRGIAFEGEFLDEPTEKQAELWSFTSSSPPGICLALPRYPSRGGVSNQAKPLGIICLGTQRNKACFFDNPNGREFERNREVSINEFRGGADLDTNSQGTCTDCHAGENPFIVHPNKRAFEGLNTFGSGWYEPIVAAGWPQNPGPSVLLDAISPGPAEPGLPPGECNSCHGRGNGGRFPEVSTDLSGYCETVLKRATRRRSIVPPGPHTMPRPEGSETRNYANHIDALIRACTAPPSSTGVTVQVSNPDDTAFVSPPIVIDPVYRCATKVAVRGALPNARVVLFIDDSPVDPAVMRARNPDVVEFDVPRLEAGQALTATQEIEGVRSGPSATVRVRDLTADYPLGLPAPEINPTLIYNCAETIAVLHVPGATVTVKTNGGDPVSGIGSTGWGVIQPGRRPFEIGWSFTAVQELCGVSSPESAPERAVVVAAPGSLPLPALDPAATYSGQEFVNLQSLINGARTSVSEVAFGRLGEISWPISWFRNFDIGTPLRRPLRAGERLLASQRLCSGAGEGMMQFQPAQECSALPAPRIRVPLVGDNYVVVTAAIPGARIRVYDQANVELGDGGVVIILRRPLTGADTITVTQQVGDCRGLTGYRVGVHNPGSTGGN